MAIVKFDPWTAAWLKPFFDEDNWLEIAGDKGLTAYETEDEFVVKANVPGVLPEEVEVTVEGGVVTIKAEHKESKEEKKKKRIVYREGQVARYLYTTSIPCPVSVQKATAEVENGVVTVRIPKAPEAKPKKIVVKAKKK